MGIGLFHHSDSKLNIKDLANARIEREIINNNYFTPNPNPFKFIILDEKIVNKKSILLVKYKGCTTFGGKKLLLLKGKWKGGNHLDPHLLNKNHIVAARFEPNKIGWKMAKKCAKIK